MDSLYSLQYGNKVKSNITTQFNNRQDHAYIDIIKSVEFPWYKTSL